MNDYRSTSIRGDWKILGILFIFSSVVLFFISQDSYLYDLHTRVDSAFFYMCGKAWMNGLTPYVDFSDSKGPLLWLIYGMGYLLHPTDYLGVFWISCVWYALTFFITYKIVDLFLHDSIIALSCAILMTLAFFNPWFHDEIRAEDFCLLFMNLSLYSLCRIMYSDRVSNSKLYFSFAILGFCFGAVLMIKYSIAAMQAVFIICSLVVLIKERINWWKPFLYGVTGFFLITLPFIIFFLIKGNLSPFIQEYFVKTFQTVRDVDPNWCPRNILLSVVHTDNPILIYLLEWGDLIYTPKILIVFVSLIFGGLLFVKNNSKYKWMPLVVSVMIFALTIRHHTDYYFTICSFLFVFLSVELFKLFSIKSEKKTIIIAMAIASVIIPFHILAYSFKILIFNNNVNQKDYYRVSYVMSQVENPTIVNAYSYEQGFGVLSESLPAGKYWAKQNGMTPEMRKEHEDLIVSGKADFIIINEEIFEDRLLIKKDQLLNLGYKEYLRFGASEEYVYILFSNKDGLDVIDNATPSLMELFLKKPVYLTQKQKREKKQHRPAWEV